MGDPWARRPEPRAQDPLPQDLPGRWATAPTRPGSGRGSPNAGVGRPRGTARAGDLESVSSARPGCAGVRDAPGSCHPAPGCAGSATAAATLGSPPGAGAGGRGEQSRGGGPPAPSRGPASAPACPLTWVERPAPARAPAGDTAVPAGSRGHAGRRRPTWRSCQGHSVPRGR